MKKIEGKIVEKGKVSYLQRKFSYIQLLPLIPMEIIDRTATSYKINIPGNTLEVYVDNPNLEIGDDVELLSKRRPFKKFYLIYKGEEIPVEIAHEIDLRVDN